MYIACHDPASNTSTAWMMEMHFIHECWQSDRDRLCVLYVNLLLLVPLNVCHLFDCAYFFTSIMKGLFPVNTICTGLWWLPGQLMWIQYTTNGEL